MGSAAGPMMGVLDHVLAAPPHSGPQPVPLGGLTGSFPAAVVLAVLFFLGLIACLANLQHTGYQRYLVQGISCLFRGIGFSCRAAALRHFGITVFATSFAGGAAGYGITVAVLILVLADWVKHARVFKDSSYKRPAYVLVILLFPCIILLGPVSGIIAAGLLFSGQGGEVANVGVHMRLVAVYGMLAVLVATIVIATVYLVIAARHAIKSVDSEQDDLLLGILILLGLILLIRAGAGAASMTHPILQNEDHHYYALQALPELLELTIACIPTLLARIGKASLIWPTAHKLGKEAAKEAGKHDPPRTNGSHTNGVKHDSGKEEI